MIVTAEIIKALHSALYLACGLPALEPSMGDTYAWRDFLREMEPLDDPHAGGPLTPQDITATVEEMRRANKSGQAQWSLRPGKILRAPEAFRDLVLIARKKRQARPMRPQSQLVEQVYGGVHRQVEVPTEDGIHNIGEAFAKLRDAL